MVLYLVYSRVFLSIYFYFYNVYHLNGINKSSRNGRATNRDVLGAEYTGSVVMASWSRHHFKPFIEVYLYNYGLARINILNPLLTFGCDDGQIFSEVMEAIWHKVFFFLFSIYFFIFFEVRYPCWVGKNVTCVTL